MGKGGIPDRWEAYSNMGRQIPGTRFIAFKVPLKEVLLNNLPPSVDSFGPRQLVDHCPSLGLVIDLTNTNRYYDSNVFLDQNIEYEKLNTEGHVVPNKNVVQRFFKIVEKFSEENESNNKLIGVHCTHGVNRTGYMICRYLIQQLGVPPDQAISDFNSARGHEQERANYLKDLRIAPWLGYSSPSYDSRGGSNRWFDEGRANGSNDGFTPPFMPHQSRRVNRRSRSAGSPVNDSRFSRSPLGHERSGSITPSPKYGWSPYGRERILKMGLFSPSPEIRGRKRSASPADDEPWRDRKRGTSPTDDERWRGRKRVSSPTQEDLWRGRKRNASSTGDESRSKTNSFKSPKFGKLYYEQYYKGQVLPQYDTDFYSRGGGGVGPHKPQSRSMPPVKAEEHHQRPRAYRGPRPYRTPPKQEELYPSTSKTPDEKERDFEGPIRKSIFSPQGPSNSILFSPPDTSNSNLFSPPDNEQSRRRSQRFQPY